MFNLEGAQNPTHFASGNARCFSAPRRFASGERGFSGHVILKTEVNAALPKRSRHAEINGVKGLRFNTLSGRGNL